VYVTELSDIYDPNKAPSSMLTSPGVNETSLLGDDVERGPLGEGGLGGVSPPMASPGMGPGSASMFEKKRKRIRIGMGKLCVIMFLLHYDS